MNKRRVLEFVAVRRSDSKRWAIPGGFHPYGQDPVEAMKKIFTGKCLNDELSAETQAKVNTLFQGGMQV